MGLLDRYYRINQATGISIHIHTDGSLNISLCTVIATGNELNIQTKATGLTELSKLTQYIQPKSVIALNISGRGILQKQTDRTDVIDQQNLSAILPNINLIDFYIQNFVSGETSFLSVIRKSEADRWIDNLTSSGFRPLLLSLGPFVIDNIFPQLNIYEPEFILDGHVIKRNDKGDWTGYTFEESLMTKFPVKLESERIDVKLVIPYANAFQLVLADKLDLITANCEILESELKGKLAANKLKAQGALVLFTLFALLLVNFVLFSWLNTSNGRLEEQASANDQNTSALQKVDEQVKKKEAQLQTLGWDGGINKSSLVDQVASLLPAEINLTAIMINPIDQATSRTNKSLEFFKRKMQISGVSGSILPVNEWMARIKTRHWIKSVQLENYSYDSEQNTGKFLITIDY
jgi:Tfp pilus assembly protein PilN